MKCVVMRSAYTAMPLLRRQRMGTPKIRRSSAPIPWYDVDTSYPEKSGTVLMDTPNFQFEPFYRVLLHYNNWTEGKQIARIVRMAVPIVSADESIRVVEMAEIHETAIVVTVPKDDAELFVQRLVVAGLLSSMEIA